jgi:hypothetical protein
MNRGRRPYRSARVAKAGIATSAIGDGAETVDEWQRPDRGRSRYALQRPILGVARTNFSIFSVDCGAVYGKLLSSAGGQLVSPRTDVSERPKSVRESSLPVWFARALVTMVLRLLASYFRLMF